MDNGNLLEIKQKSIPILQRYGISKAYLFGSFARGDSNSSSDIDILIEYAPDTRRSLLILAQMKRELKSALKRNVDLQTEEALSPYIKSDILKERLVIM